MKKTKSPLENIPLRRKIFIAFSLISLLPLLFVFAYFTLQYTPLYSLIILGIIILLGWWIIFRVFRSISAISDKAHERGDIIGYIPEARDEVTVLDEAFDNMFIKVKKSFEELSEISRNTEKLNKEVSHKVTMLSTILQINDLAFKRLDMGEVFQFTAGRLKDILNCDVSFILLDVGTSSFMKEALTSREAVNFDSIPKDLPLLRPLMEDGQAIILDKNHPSKEDLKSFASNLLKVNALVLMPLVLKNKVVGILGIANKDANSFFSDDELESLNVFARHLSLIFEHREMSRKIKDLEIVDALTGLYNERFIRERLDEEIKRGMVYQRPCGFIIIKIVRLKDCMDKHGILFLETALRNMANCLRENLGVSEKAGRVAEDELGIIVPEESKVNLDKKAEGFLSKIKYSLSQQNIELELKVSIAENPIDGASSLEIIDKAELDLR